MMLLTICWLGLLLAMHGSHVKKSPFIFWLVSLLAFVCALLTKVILLAVLPAFIYLLLSQSSRGTWKKLLLAAVILLGLAGLISVFAPQNRLSINFFARLWNLRRGFPYEEIPKAVLEMLFAPGRGLLVYNPILLLLPLAAVKSKSASRKALVFSFLAAGGLILAQATAYGAEWWGITWGTRFLLPVLPFLLVGLAPAVEFLLQFPKKLVRLVLYGLAGFGVLFQLGGVLVSNSAYMIDLYYVQFVPNVGGVLWSLKHAPLLAHWRLLLAGAEINFAWARLVDISPGWTAVLTTSCLLLVGVGIFFLVRSFQSRTAWKLRWWLAGAVVFGVAILPTFNADWIPGRPSIRGKPSRHYPDGGGVGARIDTRGCNPGVSLFAHQLELFPQFLPR